jgi:hypothetical protein
VLGKDGDPAAQGPVTVLDDTLADFTFAFATDGALTLGTATGLPRLPQAAVSSLLTGATPLVGATAVALVDAAPPRTYLAGRNGGVARIDEAGDTVLDQPIAGAVVEAVAALPRPTDDTAVWRGYALSPTTGELFVLDLNTVGLGVADAPPLIVDGAQDLALDASGNLVLATAVGLEQIDVDNDGALAAAPRTLVPFGDPLLPFAACALRLARLGDDVVVADTCTGALLRLQVQ